MTTNFTNEQMQELMAQAQGIMDNIAEGESVRDIMANMYVEALDNKTLQQGQVMADALLDAVKHFDSDYREAKSDLDSFIRKFQHTIDEGKTCVERCNYWLRFAAALTAATTAMDDGTIDREALMQETENLSVSEEEATETLERELREKAQEALENSGILLTGLMAHADDLQAMTNADGAASLLIDLGTNEIEYRGILSMLVYTQVKTGQMENIPAEMTAAQIATLVCAQVEQTRILEGLGDGSITIDFAEFALKALGIVVLASTALAVAAVAIPVVSAFFGAIGGFLLALPAMLITITFILKGFCSAVRTWSQTSKQIIKTVASAVKAVARGAINLTLYIKETVFPAIKAKAEQLLQALRNKFRKPVVETQMVDAATGEIIAAESAAVQPVAQGSMEAVIIG